MRIGYGDYYIILSIASYNNQIFQKLKIFPCFTQKKNNIAMNPSLLLNDLNYYENRLW
jgi:hypothetical protein